VQHEAGLAGVDDLVDLADAVERGDEAEVVRAGEAG
jgi:hypothetical protein